MFARTVQSLVLGCLFVVSLRAADDPFVGKWKLNRDKSKFAGEQMKIEDLGDNKLKFTFGETSSTVTADGTFQPTLYGRTMSITREGPASFKMVIKLNGKVVDSMTHSLSDDGNTQTVKGTETKPDGSTSDYNVQLKRVGSGSGWTGTWESTTVEENSPDELDIESYDGDGLTFHNSAYKNTLNMKFDGKEYTEKGPTVVAGSTSSGKRVDAHTLEVTGKIKGKVMDHETYEVSPDGNSLTLTVHQTGQPNAVTLVYDKQ